MSDSRPASKPASKPASTVGALVPASRTFAYKAWKVLQLALVGSLTFVTALTTNEAIKAELKRQGLEGEREWAAVLIVVLSTVIVTLLLEFIDDRVVPKSHAVNSLSNDTKAIIKAIKRITNGADQRTNTLA